jgi:peroxiredoxin
VILLSTVACLLMSWSVAGIAGEEKQATTAKIDEIAPDFTLADMEGEKYTISEYKGKFVVLEWTNMDCPFVKKHYKSGNMQSLQKEYAEKDVVWLRICSSAPGKQGYFDAKTIETRTKEDKSRAAAYLVDADGKVGRMYGARTTPHMFIIDKEGKLIFAGGIDDKPSTNTADVKAATNYVADCLDAALAGEKIDVKTSRPYGCAVKYSDA